MEEAGGEVGGLGVDEVEVHRVEHLLLHVQDLFPGVGLRGFGFSFQVQICRTPHLFLHVQDLFSGVGFRGFLRLCGLVFRNTVELIYILGALFPRGGPVQDPVLTGFGFGVRVQDRFTGLGVRVQGSSGFGGSL